MAPNFRPMLDGTDIEKGGSFYRATLTSVWGLKEKNAQLSRVFSEARDIDEMI